ncbi:MAG: hypothetical protein HY784_15570 [Chloroflexi bacterium]|nr:hypothetical protein [Chloroflexota bacterium]
MLKAQNLTEAIRLFNPVQPLSGEALAEFYVDRKSDALGEMEKRLIVAREGEPIKMLLTGQIGCGKSTELNRLAENLRRQYFIVSFPAHRLLSLAEVTYVDLLLGMATALFREATERSVIEKAPAQILGEALEDVRLFFERNIFGSLPYRPPEEKAELAVKMNRLAAELQTKFTNEGYTRDDIRGRLERRVGELIEKINLIAEQVRLKYRRPVLFIVEGTDKPDRARARDMFLGHGESLTSPLASIIYTFPLDLRYSLEFNDIQARFAESYFLPNMRLWHLDGSPDEQGRAQLAAVVSNRMSADLTDRDAREALIAASGGLLRILVRVVQRAAVRALERNRITLADAQASLDKERNDLIAMLAEGDYATLAARRADKRLVSGDPATQQLLRSLALLEYRNQKAWCNVNPLLTEAVQETAALREATP